MSELEGLTKALQIFLGKPVVAVNMSLSYAEEAKFHVRLAVQDMMVANKPLSTADLFEMRKRTGINLHYIGCDNAQASRYLEMELIFVSTSEPSEICSQADRYLERVADFEVRKLLASSV